MLILFCLKYGANIAIIVDIAQFRAFLVGNVRVINMLAFAACERPSIWWKIGARCRKSDILSDLCCIVPK